MKKENKHNSLFEQMDKEEKEAEIDYKRIMKEDEGKDYLDILPSEFRTFKRSLLKKQVLHYIDHALSLLNSYPPFNGRIFTKNELVRYMMRGTDYSNFYLAYMFIPRIPEGWMDYAWKWREENPGKKRPENLYEMYQKENEESINKERELSHALQYLKQCWEQYQDRQKVKKGLVLKDYDIEKDGFPRTSRGNMCHLFIPVKGEWIKNKKGKFILFNPRNKKNEELTIIKYKEEDDIYKCINSKGKEVFLAQHEEINNCWDALFSSNKEIYSGWWNRILIKK